MQFKSQAFSKNFLQGLDKRRISCYNHFRCGGVAQLVRAHGSHP